MLKILSTFILVLATFSCYSISRCARTEAQLTEYLCLDKVDTILLAERTYNFNHKIMIPARKNRPITIAGVGTNRSVIISDAVETINITRPNVTLQNIHFIGKGENCHALQILDSAINLNVIKCVFEGSREASIKQSLSYRQGIIKTRNWPWPNNIRIIDCEHLGPARFINIDGADSLLVRGCVSRNVVKARYHCFVKGGSGYAIFENNLIIGGGAKSKVAGISFGDGGMAQEYHPYLHRAVYLNDKFVSKGPEAYHCLARNNVMLNLTDYAFHINQCDGAYIINNSVINCRGLVQVQPSQNILKKYAVYLSEYVIGKQQRKRIDWVAQNNLINGYAWPTSTAVMEQDNYYLKKPDLTIFKNAAGLDFRIERQRIAPTLRCNKSEWAFEDGRGVKRTEHTLCGAFE